MTTTIIIFGASGDLTKRKLIPALFNKYKKGKLEGDFNIVGVSRTEYSHDDFRKQMQEGVQEFSKHYDDSTWEEFSPKIRYIAADASLVKGFDELKKGLKEVEDGDVNRLY